MSVFIVLLVVIIIMAATYRPRKLKPYLPPNWQKINYIEIDEFDGGMMRRMMPGPGGVKCPCSPAVVVPDAAAAAASGTVTSPVLAPVTPPALSASRMHTRCARTRCNGGARYNGRRRYSMRADGEIVDENGLIVDGGMPVIDDGGMPVIDDGGMPVIDDGGMPVIDDGGMPVIDDGGMPVIDDGGMPVDNGGGGGGGIVDILPSEDDAAAALNMVFPTMVFIYMDGCSFCDKAKPDYVQLARENPGVHMTAINARRAHRLATANQIDGFPAFLTNFGPQRKIVGFKPKGTMQRVLHAARVSLGGAHRIVVSPVAPMRSCSGGERIVVSPVPVHSARGGGGGGAVTEVTEAGAMALLANPSSKPVIVFLYTTWCGFCKKMKPVYESLASKFPGVQMVMVNADNAAKLVADNKITGYPSFLRNFGHKSAVGTAAARNLIKDVGYKSAVDFSSILALSRGAHK